MIDAEKFPALAKMQSVQGVSQAVGEFIDWLAENGMAICTPRDELRGTAYYPVLETPERLLARHFGVDLDAVELERRAVLREVATS